MGDVWPLQKVRALVCSPDRDFLRVSAFLLTRHRFQVETAEDIGELLERLTFGRAQAVLFDLDRAPEHAAPFANALSVVRRPLGVVFVAAARRTGDVCVLDKWSSLREISATLTETYARALNDQPGRRNRLGVSNHDRLLPVLPGPTDARSDASAGGDGRTSRVALGAS
jgi:hypothetical protein